MAGLLAHTTRQLLLVSPSISCGGCGWSVRSSHVGTVAGQSVHLITGLWLASQFLGLGARGWPAFLSDLQVPP